MGDFWGDAGKHKGCVRTTFPLCTSLHNGVLIGAGTNREKGNEGRNEITREQRH